MKPWLGETSCNVHFLLQSCSCRTLIGAPRICLCVCVYTFPAVATQVLSRQGKGGQLNNRRCCSLSGELHFSEQRALCSPLRLDTVTKLPAAAVPLRCRAAAASARAHYPRRRTCNGGTNASFDSQLPLCVTHAQHRGPHLHAVSRAHLQEYQSSEGAKLGAPKAQATAQRHPSPAR